MARKFTSLFDGTRRNRSCEHLIDYLTKAEAEAPRDDEKDVYCFCRRLVSLAFDCWADPYVAAFYYHYGRHPKKLIPEWLGRDEKNRRLDIPDYDPLSDPLCKLRIPPPRLGLMYQMSASGWPAEQDSLRDSQEEESAGEPQISHTGAEDLARPNAFLEARRLYQAKYREGRVSLAMCTQCQNPVCEESRCLCALHLQRAREAGNAHYERKRLAMGKTVQHGKGWHERHQREAAESVISGGFCGS